MNEIKEELQLELEWIFSISMEKVENNFLLGFCKGMRGKLRGLKYGFSKGIWRKQKYFKFGFSKYIGWSQKDIERRFSNTYWGGRKAFKMGILLRNLGLKEEIERVFHTYILGQNKY